MEHRRRSKLIKEPVNCLCIKCYWRKTKPEIKTRKALLYFTHSHEAYKPVTKAKNGKVAVSHQSENIVKFGEKLKTQLSFNGIQTDILPVDNISEFKRKDAL